jgi:hypothetical protein
MAVSASRVTVGTTATLLSVGTGATYASSGRSVGVRNPGPSTVMLGGTTVTASTGYELRSGESMTIDIGSGEGLYGIVATGTQTVDVLLQGL